MENKKIDIIQKLEKFKDQWSPKVVAEMNDYQVKLAKISGEFIWHKHDTTDELFYIIKGNMKIIFRDGAVDLSEGEMYIVPNMNYEHVVHPKSTYLLESKKTDKEIKIVYKRYDDFTNN